MQLIHGDCISAMEQMPDGSVDLILTDPPYNIKVKRTKNGKARTEEWDCIKDYPDFMMRWISAAHRVLKPQGVMYFFHNDMNQIPEIMERIRKETDFALISFLIWDKVNYRTNRWKNGKPESHTALRSWFNTCEYILHYVKSGASKTEWDKTGLDRIYSNPELFRPLKEWYASELERLGKTERELMGFYKHVTGKPPNMFRHYFKDSQFEIPTADVYQKVFVPFGFRREYEDLRREYEDLRREYEDLRYTHHVDGNHKALIKCAPPNSTGRLHVCQKPVQLLRRLVRVSSNPRDVVLDCFMGSGSTGCAALREGRDFIGFELDAGFFAAAKKRIEEEAANPYADNLTIWDDTLTRRACRTGAHKQPPTSKSQ